MFGVCCDELMLNPGVFFHYNDANVEGVKWQEKLLCFLTHKMSRGKRAFEPTSFEMECTSIGFGVKRVRKAKPQRTVGEVVTNAILAQKGMVKGYGTGKHHCCEG